MKQRIGITMALLGDPALLILDEAINGLDTNGMRIVRERPSTGLPWKLAGCGRPFRVLNAGEFKS